MAHVIKITDSNTSDGSLKLSDRGNSKLPAGSKVIWQIRDSKVLSIQIVPKDGTTDIWSEGPAPQGGHWEGRIDEDAPGNAEYKYSINWTSASGSHTHDPIISVRPSSIDPKIVVLIVAGAVVGAVFALTFFRKRRHRL